MQAIPVIAGILLVGLMTVSGFQLVPDDGISGGTNTLTGAGVQINQGGIQTALRGELVSSSVVSVNPVITAVTTKSVQDIERTTATLRGRIVVGPEELGSAFFVYGYNRSDVDRVISSSDSFTEVIQNKRPSVQTKQLSSRIRRTKDVSTQVRDLAIEATYYIRLCVELDAALRCSDPETFQTLDGPTQLSNVRIPTIRITDTELIAGDAVQLEIRVNMRDTQDGRVYLVYGQSQSAVSNAVNVEYRDIDERGDRLQRDRVAANVIGSQVFNETITDLDDQTKHYYAACVSYDGVLDGFVCTRANSFTTPTDSYGESPRVTTGIVEVRRNTATLQGSVSMRSFRNGQAFFIYGTDHNVVDQVEGQRAMTDIRQSGDRLQRVLIDSDVDRSDSFATTVTDLDFNTTYSARLCIEFENEDERGRDRLYVACGEVRQYTTN